MPFSHPKRQKALVRLCTTLSLLLLALSAWALPRAFRLHQPESIRQLEAPAADFLGHLCPRSHLEVVQEFPLHLVVTAEADATTFASLRPALWHLYHLEESRGEQLLVVPAQPPFYWSDHRPLAVGLALAGFLLLLPGLAFATRALRAGWPPSPTFIPARRAWLHSLLKGLGALALWGALALQWLPLWTLVPLLLLRFLGRAKGKALRPALSGNAFVGIILNCYKRSVAEEILAAMPEPHRGEARSLMFQSVSSASKGTLRRQALGYFASLLARDKGRYASDAARFAAALTGEITPPEQPKMRQRRKIYSCSMCDEVFIDEESLRRHEAAHGPVRKRAPRPKYFLPVLAFLTMVGAGSFGLGALLQQHRPEPTLSQWLQADLQALVSSPLVITTLEREGQVSALLAADPSLHPLIQSRAAALGLDPNRLLCMPLPQKGPMLWPWALAVVAGLAWSGSRRPRRQPVVEVKAVPPPPPPPQMEISRVEVKPPRPVSELVRLEDIQIGLGRGLLSLVDPDKGAKLLERFQSIRRHVAMEVGVVLPQIQHHDSLQLKPNAYQIFIRGNQVAQGEVQVNQFFAIGIEEKLKNLRGTKTVDPTYGMPGVWIAPDQRGDAERLGCMIFDPVSVVATQITEMVRRHADELLTFQAASELLDRPEIKAVLSKLELQGIDRVRLWQTLQALVRERVSIRDLAGICDGLLANAHRKLDNEGLLDYARRAVGRSIAKEYMNNESTINCWILPSDVQQDILRGQNLEEVRRRLKAFVQKLQERGLQPVVISEPAVRPKVLGLLPGCRNVVSLATAEIPSEIHLNDLGE